MMKNMKKGSYTVETVVIMGVTFLVFAAILYMCSFLCGRAVMTAAAYEEAFTERNHDIGGLFCIDILEKNSLFKEKQNEVSYEGVCYSAWGDFRQELVINAKVKQISPVTFVWNWVRSQQYIGKE